MISEPTNVTHRVTATCFGQSWGLLHEGKLQRIYTSRYYRSFWNNVQI